MATYGGLPRSPQDSLTSNYSLAYSPNDDDNLARVQGLMRQENADPSGRQRIQPASPPPRLLLEEYLYPARAPQAMTSPDVPSGPSFNLADADPMAAHLLLETAMADSQQFRILSPDELDRLKKEETRLTRLIEAGRKKLYIESRVDNTAKLLQKLGSSAGSSQPSPRSPVSPKKSFLRLRTSVGSTASTETGSTRSQNDADSTKFFELAKEVKKLEKRQAELHNRKLEHTAGVLQSNYQRETSKKEKEVEKSTRPFSFFPMDDAVYGLGIRASPYLLNGTSDSFGFEDQVRSRLRQVNFKMRGLWTEFDTPSVDGHPQPPGDTASPTEQLNYLEDSLFSMTESHSKLLRLVNEARRRDSSQGQHSQQIFEVLAQLYDKITTSDAMNSPNNQSQNGAERINNESRNEEPFSLETFSAKVNATCARATSLEMQQMALKTQITQEREARRQAERAKEAEKAQLVGRVRAAYEQNLVAQDDIQILQSQLKDANALLDEAREEIDLTKQQCDLEHADELAKERNARKIREHDLTTRLATKVSELGLLRSALINNEAKIAALEKSESAANAELQDAVSQLDVVGSDLLAAENRLAAHGAAVGDASKQLNSLATEKEELQRELQSLRDEVANIEIELAAAQERASKHESSAKKAAKQIAQLTTERSRLDSEVAQLRAECEKLNQGLEDAAKRAASKQKIFEESSREVADLTGSHEKLEDEIEHLRNQIVTLSTAVQEAEDRARDFELSLRDKTQQVSALESEKVATEAKVAQRKEEIHELRADLEGALSAKRSELDDLSARHGEIVERLKESGDARLEAENTLKAQSQQLGQLSKKHADLVSQMEQSNNRVELVSAERRSVRTQLEEAQREQKESQARAFALEKELGEMVADYEHLVRIEVDGEKERVALENTVDTLRDRVEQLGRQLTEGKVRAMAKAEGESKRGVSNGTNGDTSHVGEARQSNEGISIAVMRNEFRKIMKEAKAEHYRALRTEQEERRRLEAIVRSLQRDRGRPQSSALSGVSLDNASLLSASDVFSS